MDDDGNMDDDAAAGWADLLSDIGNEADSQATSSRSAPEIAQPGKKKRGRPFGTGGTNEYRAELRQRHACASAASEPQAEASLSDRRRAFAAAARRAKQGQKLQQVQVKSEAEAASSSNVDATAKFNQQIVAWVGKAVWDIGNPLQKQLLLSSLKLDTSCHGTLTLALDRVINDGCGSDPTTEKECPEAGQEDEPDNHQMRTFEVYDLLCSNRPAAMSLEAASWATSVSQKMAGVNVLRLGSAVIEASGLLIGMLLQSISELCKQSGWTVPCLICRRLYDETPTRIRTVQGNDDGSAKATKVLQTELSIAILIKTVSNDYLVCKVFQPCWLQSMDRTTAENTKSAQLDLMDVVPGLHSFAATTNGIKIQMPVTDRFSSNIKAEKSIQHDLKEDYGAKYVLLHQLCKTHKLASVQKYTADLCDHHVSGLISTAVSMQTGGSIYALRKALMSIIEERLVIKRESAPGGPCTEHRRQVFDLYLKPHPVKHSADTKSRSLLNRTRNRQRVILEFYLNGDLQSNVIEHYTSRIVSKEQLLQEFNYYVVPALLPHRAPVFPRSRWVGADNSLDWVGLLLSTHNLFSPMMCTWARSFAKENSEASKPAEPPPVDNTWLTLLGTADLLSIECKPSNVAADAAEGPDIDLESGEEGRQEQDLVAEFGLQEHDNVAEAAMHLDRAKFNDTMRKRACKWASLSGLASAVAVFRHCIAPAMSAMHRNLFIGSEAWDTDQEVLAAKGMQRSYKVLDEASGNGVAEFNENLYHRFHSLLPAVQDRSKTRSTRALAFRLLSRTGSGMHHFVEMDRQTFPVKLFEGMVSNDANLVYESALSSGCLLDEISEQFLQQFPNAESYNSADATAILLAMATMWEVDITLIEARHAAVRRLVKARSVQTHVLKLDFLNGDYACRQHARQLLRFYPERPQTLKKKKASAKVRKISKKTGKPIRRPGGAWKAFMHVNLKGKFSRQSMGQLAQQYRSLHETEKEWFKDLGEMAKLRAASGLAGFGDGNPLPAQPVPPASVLQPQSDLQLCLQDAFTRLKTIEKNRQAELAKDRDEWQLATRPGCQANPILDSIQKCMNLQRQPYVWCPAPIPTVHWLPPAAALAEAGWV